MEENNQNEQKEDSVVEKVLMKDINEEKDKELVDKVMDIILKIK